MAKCFTCGWHIDDSANRYTSQSLSGLFPSLYTCTHCENLKAMQDVRKMAQAQAVSLGAMSSQLDTLTAIERQGFEQLSGDMKSGFNQVNAGIDRVNENIGQLNSVIRWGLEDLGWKIVQQTDVMKSIDETLKTPRQTEANELRQMAEHAFAIGVMDDSTTYFLESLAKSTLDYRTYIGLAHAYLAQGKFDEAKMYLERSLPHAPNKEIDYRSYSYRLIGRIHFAREENPNAVMVLKQAVALSPDYPDALYDYAQYTALVENADESVVHLKKAISIQPYLWIAAQTEPIFSNIRTQVDAALEGIAGDTAHQVTVQHMTITSDLNSLGDEIDGLISRANKIDHTLARHLQTSVDQSAIQLLKQSAMTARNTLNNAKHQINARNLITTLEAQEQMQHVASVAVETSKQARSVAQQLHDVTERFQTQIEDRNKSARQRAANSAWSVWWLELFLAAVATYWNYTTTGDVHNSIVQLGISPFILGTVLTIALWIIFYAMGLAGGNGG